MLSSYGSIYALGHRAVADILNGSCEVTEKVDGSQCSFGIVDGELFIRSKNQPLYIGANNGMFNLAVEQIQAKASFFRKNFVYRGEFLMKPKHNSLAYSRVPTNNIMIYDIEKVPGSEDYLTHRDRDLEATRIGFEPVPTLYEGPNITLDMIMGCLQLDSVLNGVKVEGVVIKNYDLFLDDKKVARAKYVSSEFKETHQKEWKKTNPGRTDVIEDLVKSLRTEARWRKGVQHLRDDGNLEGSPRDIGNLIKTVQQDVIDEEADTIKEILFNHFKGQISRGVVHGLPDWFKEQLATGSLYLEA